MLEFPGPLWFFSVFYLIKMFKLKVSAPSNKIREFCTGPMVNAQWKSSMILLGHYRSFMIV